MESKKVGKDLLLAFLYAGGKEREKNEAILGRTRIEKMMFIFEKELKNDFYKNKDVCLPEFIPYLYGPYSSEVADDLDFFITIGMIDSVETSIIADEKVLSIKNQIDGEDDLWDEINVDDNVSMYEMKYELTEAGINYVQERIWNDYSINQQSVITRLKTQINSMPLDTLLKYVYTKYPEYAKESLIRDRYL